MRMTNRDEDNGRKNFSTQREYPPLGEGDGHRFSAAFSAAFKLSSVPVKAVLAVVAAGSLGGGAYILDTGRSDGRPYPTECEACLAEREALIERYIADRECAVAIAEAKETLFQKGSALSCGPRKGGAFVEGLDYPGTPFHPGDWKTTDKP